MLRPPKPRQFTHNPPQVVDLMPSGWRSAQERDAMLTAGITAHVDLTVLVLNRMIKAWEARAQ
jgi:hypothetical protein